MTSSTTRSVIEPTAKIAYGRHRRDGSRPSGNTNVTASGHAKNTGHSEATSAAHDPPGSEPGCASSATHAYGSAASTATSDSAPTTRIQPIGLRGRRATISAPTAAGVQLAARRNGYSHHAPDPGTSSAAATRSSTSPAAVRTKAVRARPQAIRRDTICTGHSLSHGRRQPQCCHRRDGTWFAGTTCGSNANTSRGYSGRPAPWASPRRCCGSARCRRTPSSVAGSSCVCVLATEVARRDRCRSPPSW